MENFSSTSLTPGLLVVAAILLALLLLSIHVAVAALLDLPAAVRALTSALSPRGLGFDSLEPGPVALRGRVAPIDPVISPETGEHGIYLTYAADEWGASHAVGRLGGQWLRAEEAEDAAPFELTDGQHSVLVEPEGAEFRIKRDVWVKREQADGKLIRYNEGLIKEGDELLILGTCRVEGGFEPSSGYRGHNYRVVVAAPMSISRPAGQAGRLGMQLAWRLARVLPLVMMIWITGTLVT